MSLIKDYKFLLMLLVTAIPIYLWHIDHQGVSLEARLNSTASLQSFDKSAIPELQILINGKVVAEPYISVIELKNNSSKPIQKTDFEGTLKIGTSQNVSIIEANIIRNAPKEIEAKIVGIIKKKIEIQPILINPDNIIRVAIITAGGVPQFKVESRIAGLISEPVISLEAPETNHILDWLYFFIALIFSFCSAFLRKAIDPVLFTKKKVFTLYRSVGLSLTLITFIASLSFYMAFLDGMGTNSFWLSFTLMMLLTLIASLITGIVYPWLESSHEKVAEPQASKMERPKALPLTKPASRASQVTFEEIAEAIKNSPPMQRDKVAESFLGLQVEWDAYFRSGKILEGDIMRLHLSVSPGPGVLNITCKVNAKEYSEFGILHEGSKVRISGILSSVGRFDIEMENVQIHIFQG